MENKKIKEYGTEEQINLTLQSTEGMHRAKANPFLYEKVMSRLNQKPVQTNIPGWNYNTGIKYALVMLIFILLNVATILQISYETTTVNITKDTFGETSKKKEINTKEESKGYFDDFINNNSYNF
ncbi:MAG: hypothetical protein J0M18_12670 [Ignavibacteria bacterium]|jgi:hypothetical protein|nr:hypothetical protein [Ignavibacteria bacterium]